MRGPQPRLGFSESVAWVAAHRAVSRHHLASYARMAWVRARHPDVEFQGPVFIGSDVRFEVRRGYGRIIVGPWCHFGEGARIRCHEGTLRIGAKSILAARVTVNTWLDIDIGTGCLLGDGVYVCDFDHRLEELDRPIKDQGIVKTPVRLADDVWLGTKSTVTRGTRMGQGAVLAANSVAKGDYPAYSIVAGSPAQVVRYRDPRRDWQRRAEQGRAPRLREVLRAVIIDSAGRILLCRLDGTPMEPVGRPWACPGGVALPTEDVRQALVRLVAERTGLRVTDVEGSAQEPLWVEETLSPMARWDGRREVYLRVRVADEPPSGHSWAQRAQRDQEPRWWGLAQLTDLGSHSGAPGGLVPRWLPARLEQIDHPG